MSTKTTRREAWQALHDRDEGVEREVDGRLSDRAAHYWPGAVVVCEYIAGGEERWYLERVRGDGSLARTGIGSNYHAAVRALNRERFLYYLEAGEARRRALEAAG